MQEKFSPTTVPIELLRKYDRPGPRYTSYPTAPSWTEEVGSNEYISALESAAFETAEPLAIYCHIPFCRKRCFYCGCNTSVSRGQSSANDYIGILKSEISRTSQLLGDRRTVNQFHFGGGTPTFVEVAGLEKIIRFFQESFDFPDGCEKSIELDPRVTTPEQLDFLADCGFNRASIGVQDFNPQVQEAIGRIQPRDSVVAVIEHCRRLNFKGINFDLIYGLPRQTVSGFNRTLDEAIALRPDRVAVYSFAYLPNVKAHQSRIHPEELPSTEEKYQLFASAIEKFTAAGYRQIGMDHFALPEDELSIAQADGRLHRNFMGYTVKTAPEMIGFGMSAIGYVDNAYFQNHSKLTMYNQKIADSGLAVFRGMKLSRDDLIRGYLITSLMCNFRLGFDRLNQLFDVDYHGYFQAEHENLKMFFQDNFLLETASGLEITELGRTFVRNIAMIFDAYLSRDGKSRKATFSRTI